MDPQRPNTSQSAPVAVSFYEKHKRYISATSRAGGIPGAGFWCGSHKSCSTGPVFEMEWASGGSDASGRAQVLSVWPGLVAAGCFLSRAAAVISAYALFLFAIAGRLFCGYACPVVSEIFMCGSRTRLRGDRSARMKLDKGPMTARKIGLKAIKTRDMVVDIAVGPVLRWWPISRRLMNCWRHCRSVFRAGDFLDLLYGGFLLHAGRLPA